MYNKSFFLKSNGENTYFFNKSRNTLFLSHPIMAFINGKQQKTDHQNIENKSYWENPKYYQQKYNFLNKHKIIDNYVKNNFLKTTIKPNEIEESIANINQVTFEVTDACNLKCEYCGYGELYDNYDPRSSIRLEVLKAKKLLEYLADYWNSSLNTSYKRPITISFYGGEPLINFEFIKIIVDFTKSLNLKNNYTIFSITTNAVLLHKHINYLVENNFQLVISLDGNRENNGFRLMQNGKESFNHICKNINQIRKDFPDFFKTNVNFNSVIHSKNSVIDIYKFFISEFEKIPLISSLNTTGISDTKKDDFLNMYKNINDGLYQSENYDKINYEMFINLPDNHSATLFVHEFSEFVYMNYSELFPIIKEKLHIPTGTCFPFSKKMFVTVNGDILPCERIGQNFKLGKVTNQGVNISPEKISQFYMNFFRKVFDQCFHCFNSETCKQCIFIINQIEDKPKCQGFMSFKTYSNYLSSHLSYLELNKEIFIKIMEEVNVEY